MNFLEELKRRHVYRVAAAYAVVGWLLIQVATQVFPVFHLPDWIDQAVVLLILIGFPIALVLAWAFDTTSHGIVATDAQEAEANPRVRRRSRRAGMAVGAIGVLIALIAGGAYWHFGRPAAPSVAKVADTAHGATDRRDSAAVAASSGVRVASVPASAQHVAALEFREKGGPCAHGEVGFCGVYGNPSFFSTASKRGSLRIGSNAGNHSNCWITLLPWAA